MIIKRRKRVLKKKVSKAIQKYVHKAIESEDEKKWQVANFTFMIQQTGAAGFMNFLMKGAGQNQRIGNKIRITNLEWRGYVQNNTAAVIPSNIRLMVIWDKQPNGATFLAQDVFVSPTAGVLTQSPYNPNTVPSRFTIMADQVLSIGVNGGSTNISDIKHFHITRKMRKVAQYNNGNVGDVTDISTGALYVYFVTDVLGASNPFLNSVCIIRYEDA